MCSNNQILMNYLTCQQVLQQSCHAQRQYWIAEGASRASRMASPAQPPQQGPERRKPLVTPKSEKRVAPDSVSKKRTGDDAALSPPAKKKLNVSGNFIIFQAFFIM